MCYDTLPVILPHLFASAPWVRGFGEYLTDVAECADAIFCISESTQRDLLSVLHNAGAPKLPPTYVIRLGSEIHRSDEAANEPPPGLGHKADPRPFVLFVSTIERRKNHDALYRAWVRLREQGLEPYRLVFVGRRGWGVKDLMMDIELDPRIRTDIVVLDSVNKTGNSPGCTDTARSRSFRLLYEGWGLPVVESLAWGKFCIASNAASLPEAGGDLVEYIDPWDLPSWVERLGHYMRNPQDVERHNERIAREFRATSWREACAAIHDVVVGS